MGTPSSSGIVGGIAIRVRITGYRTRMNEHVPPGTVGLLEPTELSVQGDVINAVFRPDGGGVCGLVWPLFEAVPGEPFVPPTRD